MGCISDLAPDGQALQLRRQDLEHGNTRNKGSGTQGNLKLIGGAIIVSDDLVFTPWYLHRIQGGNLWRGEVVQSSVDVPAVKTGITIGSIL